jgi:uncharacterized protein YggT (Ycf19 family)
MEVLEPLADLVYTLGGILPTFMVVLGVVALVGMAIWPVVEWITPARWHRTPAK